MKALIVDDSLATRSFIRRMLEELGAAVCEAEHGENALAELDANPDVEFLLIDWNMPVMNGLTLVTSIRARPEYKRLKLVMVTSESSVERVREALDAGANEYIMKPFTREVLQEKLRLIGLGVG